MSFEKNKKTMDLIASSNTDEWETPDKFFNEWDKEFNFTLDPCATSLNTKCEKYYTKEQNGLLRSWEGERVFCNPPYSDIKNWVKKCFAEKNDADMIVMLIFVRTDTKYFHEWIYPYVELRFIKGRIKFSGAKYNAPFPSMLCIYNKNTKGQTTLKDHVADQEIQRQKEKK